MNSIENARDKTKLFFDTAKFNRNNEKIDIGAGAISP